MADGVITRNAIRRKIVVYEGKRAKEENNAPFGKQTITNIKSLPEIPSTGIRTAG